MNFFSGERINEVDRLLFTKHLSVMLKSGVTIGEAIHLLTEQATNPRLRKIILSIQKYVDNGKTLYEALEAHPKAFDPLYVRLIDVGEESGNLQRNLEYLAVQLKKKYDFERKVRSALLYPAVILVAAGIAGAGISLFVLPKLVDLFSALDVSLPLATKILLFIANAMKNWGLFIILGITGFLLVINWIIHSKPVQPYWHKFLLIAPVLGPFNRNVQLALFCRNMGIMLQSGLPIDSALFSQTQATTNVLFRHYFDQLQKNVQKGKSLEEIFNQNKFTYIPPIVDKMIGVGEKTGKLDESFLYLGDFFEDEVDDMTRNLSTVLEPMILLVIGLAVAYLAYAIIAPIYQFTGSIGK